MDVCLRVEAVKPATSQRVPGVSRLDAKPFHAVTHLGVLSTQVFATLSLATVSKPP